MADDSSPAEASSKKEVSKNSQAPDSAAPSQNKSSVAPPKRPANPNRIVIGKGNLLRDVLIFLTILTFISLMALSMNDVGRMEKGYKSPLTRVRESLEKRFQEELAQARKAECSYFLAPSSIPGVEFGLFAGKNYSTGDIVLDAHPYFPFYLDDDYRNVAFLSHASYSMNHHPMLQNLEGSLWKSNKDQQANPLRATRSIVVGEELFVSFRDHPHGEFASRAGPMFESIPVQEDYIVAQELVQEAQKRMKPKKMNPTKQQQDSDMALNLVKKAVERFNHKVASLLPSSKKELTKLTKGRGGEWAIALDGLKNRTANFLAIHGHCLDDVSLKTGEGDEPMVVANRPISQGSTVVTIPLHIVQQRDNGNMECQASEEESCSSSLATLAHSQCLQHPSTPLIFCPQSVGAFIRFAEEGANVQFQWSSWNSANEESHKLSLPDLASPQMDLLTWDVVALKDIEVGEEIRTATDLLHRLLPETWLVMGA